MLIEEDETWRFPRPSRNFWKKAHKVENLIQQELFQGLFGSLEYVFPIFDIWTQDFFTLKL